MSKVKQEHSEEMVQPNTSYWQTTQTLAHNSAGFIMVHMIPGAKYEHLM